MASKATKKAALVPKVTDINRVMEFFETLPNVQELPKSNDEYPKYKCHNCGNNAPVLVKGDDSKFQSPRHRGWCLQCLYEFAHPAQFP
jgi:transposase-like protein